MAELITELNKAYTLVRWWREGGIAWIIVLDRLVDAGFYGINQRGKYVTAYLNGLRVEL